MYKHYIRLYQLYFHFHNHFQYTNIGINSWVTLESPAARVCWGKTPHPHAPQTWEASDHLKYNCTIQAFIWNDCEFLNLRVWSTRLYCSLKPVKTRLYPVSNHFRVILKSQSFVLLCRKNYIQHFSAVINKFERLVLKVCYALPSGGRSRHACSAPNILSCSRI